MQRPRQVNSIAQAKARLREVEELATEVLLWAAGQRQTGELYSASELAAVEERADTIASKATALRRHLEGMRRRS